jgi:hypothetical protein
VVAPSPGAAATRPLRHARAAACSRAHRPATSDGALHAGLACLVAQPVKRGHLARVRHRPPLTNATSAALPAAGPARPSIEPLQDAAAHRDSTRPCGDGCPPPSTWSHRRRLRWDEMDASGRTEADGSRLDAGRVDTGRTGHRTGWTPDGLDTGCTGHHRPDTGRLDRRTRTTEPLSGHHMVDADQRRRHGRHPGIADHGDNARPLDASWTLRRAAAVWATNQPGQLGSRTTGTGPATAGTVSCRCYSTVQLAPRRTAVLGRLRPRVGRRGGGHPVYGEAWEGAFGRESVQRGAGRVASAVAMSACSGDGRGRVACFWWLASLGSCGPTGRLA